MSEIITMESLSWVPIVGQWEQVDNRILFQGDTPTDQSGKPLPGPYVGNYICDRKFMEGKIKCKVQFAKITPESSCQIIFNYDAKNHSFCTAGIIQGPNVFGVAAFVNGKWDFKSFIGNRSFLKPDKEIDIEVKIKGSNVILKIDNVFITEVDISAIKGQVGIWCLGDKDDEIVITDFTIETEQPYAFVIIEYKNPYFDIYSDVIRSVCSKFKTEARIALNATGPGMILSDIIKDIRESRFVIADITPDNPNVYYEVGYSHALNKPTILIADNRRERLPFDVSSFRTLFYENSIGGKTKLEEGLSRHLGALIDDSD